MFYIFKKKLCSIIYQVIIIIFHKNLLISILVHNMLLAPPSDKIFLVKFRSIQSIFLRQENFLYSKKNQNSWTSIINQYFVPAEFQWTKAWLETFSTAHMLVCRNEWAAQTKNTQWSRSTFWSTRCSNPPDDRTIFFLSANIMYIWWFWHQHSTRCRGGCRGSLFMV